MIRSTKHYVSYANTNKRETIRSFLAAYRFATRQYIDYIWTHHFINKEGFISFDIQSDILDFLPKFIDYQAIKFDTKLSARALSASIDQAVSIVRGAVAIRRKLLYTIRKRKEQGLPTDYFEKKLDKNKISKPILKENFNAELSSKNLQFKQGSKHFNLFIRLISTGFNNIYIPIQYHKRDKKWLSQIGSKQLAGILISDNCIQIRYDIPDPPKKTKGKIVGADTGLKTILTLSNKKTTPQTDKHGHSLESICTTLSRRIKDSKGFKRAQAHRTNFINWSIKQINLDDVKEIKLEKVINIFYGRNTSKKLKRWTNADIQKQIMKLGEEAGVQISLQPSTYKSQRCSGCGVVRKANRKGKEYHCKVCGLKIDSDLNAAINNEKDLPNISYALRCTKLNREGFYWLETGLFDLNGQELKVPDANKKLSI